MDVIEPELANEDKRKKQENDITHMKKESDEPDTDNVHPYHNELEELPESEEMDLSNRNNEEGNDVKDNAGEEGIENPYDMDK